MFSFTPKTPSTITFIVKYAGYTGAHVIWKRPKVDNTQNLLYDVFVNNHLVTSNSQDTSILIKDDIQSIVKGGENIVSVAAKNGGSVLAKASTHFNFRRSTISLIIPLAFLPVRYGMTRVRHLRLSGKFILTTC